MLLHLPTLACPSLAVVPSGPLMIIGGAEDKLRRPTILREFVGAAGGEEARIAVIATASSLGPEVVEVYDAVFRKLGAAEVVSVEPELIRCSVGVKIMPRMAAWAADAVQV